MWRRILVSSATLAVLAVVPACGGDDTENESFTLEVVPEFVQGVIPGAVTGVLVGVVEHTGDPVTITASAEAAVVTVDPTEIVAGEVAEVTVVADAAAADRPIEIVVVGTRGDVEVAESRSTSVTFL